MFEQIDSIRKKAQKNWELKGTQKAVLFSLPSLSSFTSYALTLLEQSQAENNKEKAKFIQEILAPLAYNLNLLSLKFKLEDEAFKLILPKAHKDLSTYLQEIQGNREKRRELLSSNIEQLLEKETIQAQLKTRIKNIYGVYEKMKRKELSMKNLFDFVGIRIIVPSVEECYITRELLTKQWRERKDRYKDYIINPKENGYQSLHLVLEDEGGKILEIQIRTKKMDDHAERKEASHLNYKSANYGKSTDKLLLQCKEEFQKDKELSWKNMVSFTPRGQAIVLPKKSVVLDFAYAVHSEIGDACIGAFVNGNYVSPKETLENGDTVEIVTKKNQKQSVSNLKLVQSTKAKHYLRKTTS